ncbi:spike stability protein [Enterobacteria phage PRDwine]
MDKKKLLYWVAGGLVLILLWLWLRNRPAAQVASNWEGPPYMTYNQPGAGTVTLPVAGYSSPSLTIPQSNRSCGCNPAVSAAMAQGSDLAAKLTDSITSQLNQYADSLNDYLASQAGV